MSWHQTAQAFLRSGGYQNTHTVEGGGEHTCSHWGDNGLPWQTNRTEDNYHICQRHKKELDTCLELCVEKLLSMRKSEPQTCAIPKRGARVHTVHMAGRPRAKTFTEKLVWARWKFMIDGTGNLNHHIQTPPQMGTRWTPTKNLSL